jgi:hypothetical protein
MMKNSALLFLILGLVCSNASALEAGYPLIYFQYSPAYDSKYCPTAHEITPEWVASAQTVVSSLQSAWDLEAPVLLGAVAKTIRPFRTRGEIAGLFLCRDLVSFSYPLFISAWPFIPEAMNGKPLPLSHIKFITFHEVLHRFVTENLDPSAPTPLLKKYSEEAPNVRDHLHVMAIQKLVYLQVDPSGESLKQLLAYERGYGKDYQRAWEIVNGPQGHEAFVQELKYPIRLAFGSIAEDTCWPLSGVSRPRGFQSPFHLES